MVTFLEKFQVKKYQFPCGQVVLSSSLSQSFYLLPIFTWSKDEFVTMNYYCHLPENT